MNCRSKKRNFLKLRNLSRLHRLQRLTLSPVAAFQRACLLACQVYGRRVYFYSYYYIIICILNFYKFFYLGNQSLNKIRAACWWQADFDLYKMRNADEPGRVSLGSILNFAFRTCAKNK